MKPGGAGEENEACEACEENEAGGEEIWAETQGVLEVNVALTNVDAPGALTSLEVPCDEGENDPVRRALGDPKNGPDPFAEEKNAALHNLLNSNLVLLP